MGRKSFIGLVLFAVAVVGLLIAANSATLYQYDTYGAGSYTYNLLINSGLGPLIAAFGLGLVLGAFEGSLAYGKITPKKRPGAEILLEDWGMSFSILASLMLLISGIFIGGTWSPRLVGSTWAIGFALNAHFVGMVLLLFGLTYFVTYVLVAHDYRLTAPMGNLFSRRWRDNYKPSLRWALLTFLAVALAFLVKGAGLIGSHMLGLPEGLAVGTAIFHDIAALIALIFALVTIGFVIVENVTGEVKVAQPAKAKG